MHVEHLDRGELLERRARRESAGAFLEPRFECDLQGVGEERNENVGFDPLVELVRGTQALGRGRTARSFLSSLKACSTSVS